MTWIKNGENKQTKLNKSSSTQLKWDKTIQQGTVAIATLTSDDIMSGCEY